MTYPADKFEEILRRLAEGEPLRVICREEGMPSKSCVHNRRANDLEFAKRYDQAVLDGCYELLDETQEIADEPPQRTPHGVDSGDVQLRKLRIWTRHELIKRKRPDLFGDRMQLANDPTHPLRGMSDADLDKAIAEKLAALQGDG